MNRPYLVAEQFSIRGIQLDVLFTGGDARLLPRRVKEPLRRLLRPRTDRDHLVSDVRDLARTRVDEQIEGELVGDPAGAQDAPAAGVRCHLLVVK